MKLKNTLSFLLVCLLAFALNACSGGGNATGTDAAESGDSPGSATEFPTMIWSAATSGADGSNFAVGLTKFSELVGEATGGAVTVNVYTSDQLTNGNTVDSLQGLMEGTIDLAFQADGIWSNFDDRLGAPQLPFLFTSYEDVDEKLINGPAGEELSGIIESQFGVKCLGIGENGFRYITNSKHPVKTVEDLQGLKLRVGGSPLLIRSYELWGADYTTAGWAEIYTGLQTGLYDGQENPIAVAHASSIQEVQQYTTAWTAHYGCMFLTMNGELYNSLSDELKEIVDRCGAQACEYQIEVTRNECDEYLELWESEYGIEVHQVTPEAMAQFKALADPIYQEYEDTIGADLIALFQ